MPSVPGVPARALRASALLAVSLSYLSYVFDIFHATFWNAGLGDWIDPYFINYLLEHWFHVVTTFSDPSSPPMFFPAEKTLGYSHSLILYAPFYIPVRLFLHPFQADSLSLFIMIETGVICLYVIFRRYLQLSFAESLLLTSFFLTSQNVVNGTIGIWSQRASVFLVPPILLLALFSFHHRPDRRRLVLAGLAGFLAALLFPQDFYSGYLTFFFAALFLAAWVCVEGHVSTFLALMRPPADALGQRLTLLPAVIGAMWSTYLWKFGGVKMRVLGIRVASEDWRRPALLTVLSVVVFVWLRGVSRTREDLRTAFANGRTKIRPWLGALTAGGLVGGAVFLWIYLPSYREHPRFPESDVLGQIRVRAWRSWASPFQDLNTYLTTRSFKFITLVAIASWLPWFNVDRKTRWYLVWAFAASWLVFVMPLRLDGFSIWLSFFRHVLGFGVIRDPTRVIFEYELAFILAAGLLLARLRHQPVVRLCACLLLLIFMITDHRAEVLRYQRPLKVFHRWVESPIDIDPSCRSFFVKGASTEYMKRSDNMWSLYAGDAMFISLSRGLPTLNGYSAWEPEDWPLMNPQEPEYPDRVRTWIGMNHLNNVCGLDIDARTMRPVSLN